MTLTYPICITSRLLPGVKVGDVFISICYSPKKGTDGRTRYKWFIELPVNSYGESPYRKVDFDGDDLKSGCQGGNLREGLKSLLSFLSAAGESYKYYGRDGENAHLFPIQVVKWASENTDELSMLYTEIEENPDCIKE